ncbi:hypothetical protein [Sphingomonas phyllosphaerae]|uniref:hypothetical protein n=1 Tax=Sphingomonas phyllosphaerae TaxID=257003 RepID=UPI000426DF59|nr:hypothetical protein [Sphingomonas phyllosphaerae]
MTTRGLSVWFGLGTSLLAILVAVERPHWFGLPAAATPTTQTARAATPPERSAPWLIKRHTDPAR